MTVDYEAIYANFSGDFDMVVLVERYYLPDVYVYLPFHSLSLACVLVMLLSLARNRHMQHRPKQMFLFSCSFFALAALYNFATDISYLIMLDRQVGRFLGMGPMINSMGNCMPFHCSY